MNDGYGAFLVGMIVGLVLMGVLETCIPGVGYHDAWKAKEACEKSLPRDQTCIPNYTPSHKETGK